MPYGSVLLTYHLHSCPKSGQGRETASSFGNPSFLLGLQRPAFPVRGAGNPRMASSGRVPARTAALPHNNSLYSLGLVP